MMNDPVSPSTVESNMTHNLYMTGRDTFNYQGNFYNVETDPDYSILHRQNAMTYYENIYSWLMVAKGFGTDEVLFYMVKATIDGGDTSWVELSPEFTETHFYF
jgi:hypothetical protein